MSYNMLVRFPDQSASFVHGFEAGQWYNRLADAARLNVETIDTRNDLPIHRANEDVIIDIAKSHGFICQIFPVGTDFDETYTHCRFTRIGSPT